MSAVTGVQEPPQPVNLREQDASQRLLIESLCQERCFGHPTEHVEVIETHISRVLLTGRYAYKIKKPVNLGFLDFSTPARRKHFCEEELRLNRRYAPDIYLGVVTFSGSPAAPRISETGAGFEYAVKMVQFEQTALLSRMLVQGRLYEQHVEALASMLAAFHEDDARPCDPASGNGGKAQVLAPMLENFNQLRPLLTSPQALRQLAALERWTRETCASLATLIERRREQQRVRECHGDLHLDNIAWLHGRAVPFDGIEFSNTLRCIDTCSELAFVVMDLEYHDAAALASLLLSRYLELTGDYGALPLLPFYKTYRALVRAKVVAIRAAQVDTATAPAEALLSLADRYTRRRVPALYIMHGLSGSGKSYVAQRLVARAGALRLRSDYERKRLHGIAPEAASDSPPSGGIYSEAATERTYLRLAELAELVLGAGQSVVVDATFLERRHRHLFQYLAGRLGVNFRIVHVRSEDRDALLQHRARAAGEVSEADAAIVARQRQRGEPLDEEETRLSAVIDNVLGREPDLDALL